MKKKILSALTMAFLASCAVAVLPVASYAAESALEQTQGVDYDSMSLTDLEKLAKKKDVGATMTLAGKYWDDRNWSNASKWYKKALDKGYVENLSEADAALANYRYGYLKLEGRGGKRNIKDGYTHILRAANNGNADAMYEMYVFYSDGLVGYEIFLGDEMLSSPQTLVRRDQNEANKWLYKAAEAGHQNSLERFMTFSSYEERMKLLQSAAASGNKYALGKLGQVYANPASSEYDYEKAKDYFTRAGDAQALQALEEVNQKVLDKKAKEEEAKKEDLARQQQAQKEFDDLVAQANQGDPTALNNLGKLYYKQKNYAEAAKYYRKAADLGKGASAYNLAELYYHGKGVEKSYTEAFNLYKKAEANGLAGDRDVLYSLGYMYSRGQGVTANKSLATSYLNKAVKAGSNSAQKELNYMAKEELTTRKATNYKVLNHSYVGSANGYKSGIRFDPNGKLVYTVLAMGRDQTRTGWWRQNGTEISTSIGTFWLDSNGNLNVYDSDGDRVTWKRTK